MAFGRFRPAVPRDGSRNPFLEGFRGISIVALAALGSALAAGVLALAIALLY